MHYQNNMLPTTSTGIPIVLLIQDSRGIKTQTYKKVVCFQSSLKGMDTKQKKKKNISICFHEYRAYDDLSDHSFQYPAD